MKIPFTTLQAYTGEWFGVIRGEVADGIYISNEIVSECRRYYIRLFTLFALSLSAYFKEIP